MESAVNVLRKSTAFNSFSRKLSSHLPSYLIAYLLFLFLLTLCLDGNMQAEMPGQLNQTFSANTEIDPGMFRNGQCRSEELFTLTNLDGTSSIPVFR
ncbi:MAG: hypothetical protein D3924_15000 [Candidatus Electrothrix sp. AR4]|nr:hypothetical protein [Candidatus Electrothrix sp. AR4]